MASKVFGKSAVHTVFHFLLCCGLLAGVAHGQSAQPQAANESATEVADAIAKVRSGQFSNYTVEIIGEARAVVAIPDLEKQFTLISEPLEKAKIAQVLLLLGDKKDVYWNYLEELVKPALESDAPSPMLDDARGKSIPDLSKEFATWAQAHGKSPGEAVEYAKYILPGFVMLVGATADSRALPLLRRAFSSPNSMIQIAASKGLAEMHDVTSVPLMIERCRNAPPDVASIIAESLVYFDDPQAQNAIDTFISKEKAKILRDAKSAGEGALHHR